MALMIPKPVSRLAAFILPVISISAAYAAAPATVTGAIDEQSLTSLAGNTRPEARLANDRGKLADNFALDHLQLLLKRPPETEAALKDFIDSLHDRNSPNYHQWLTAQAFGEKFGPAPSDIAAVTSWLGAHGFVVNGIAAGGMTIDFSGTAGAVQAAFHTEMHRLDVAGAAHIANMSDPQIPQALSGVVAGVVSLNDFRPHPEFKPRPAYTVSSGGSTYQLVVPADLATIYNLTPLFAAGISGQGQTVVVIEDTNVFSTADFTSFRKTFGLSSYTSGSFTQVHPTGSNACGNPGVVAGNEGEAELDMEWASAAAPSAAIELASCSDTSTNFGGLLALQNLINSKTPPAIVSISYGECEVENGATANAAYNTTYQQAVALGVSVFVSAGDEGAASCDADLTKATHGIGVSGFASTPYNVAVGGTDFGDTYAGTNATYWSSTNTSTYGSARSYINEIPWNDSCASVLLASASGYSTTYGTSGFCNSSTGKADYLTTASGSGGPSGCATGKASISGVVSGTCKGYAKPSWQTLVGVPSDGVRDMPDVSLFAANGVWGHYYAYCDSDTRDGGAKCTGAPVNWSGAGGTSFASPILAGIQALVNQKTGAKQGNPNTVYYKLAAAEYGASGSATCNSSKGNAVLTSCIFYDVTQGDMDVNCTGSNSCYKPSGTNGVLSASDSSYLKAYGTQTGWDYATGIGSLNAANLVNNW
jgi:subtilase family serine protease